LEEELRAAAAAAFRAAEEHSTHKVGQSFALGQAFYFAARTASYACQTPAQAAAVSAGRTLYTAAVGAAGDHLPARFAAGDTVYRRRNILLNDIFGNPFRPAVVDATWLTPAVLSLAQAAYDHRLLPSGTLDPARLAELGDALEHAGCTDAGLLGQLRGPGPHVRGCYVVDVVLGKG
jgi:hypothetical protein